MVAALCAACGDDPVDQDMIDDEKVQAYLSANNITATKDESGIYYSIEEEGTGDNPLESSTVRVHYKGYLLCHLTFDQSNGVEPFETGLGSVIEGWRTGIPLFKKGTVGKLFIPSRLAYGPSGTFGIAPNTVLIFDIELVGFF